MKMMDKTIILRISKKKLGKAFGKIGRIHNIIMHDKLKSIKYILLKKCKCTKKEALGYLSFYFNEMIR